MAPPDCLRVMTAELSYRQQKLEKVMDQEGLADEEVSNRTAYSQIPHTPPPPSNPYRVVNAASPSLQKRMRRSQHARKETEFLRLKRTRLGLEDFESLKVIGRGAFGEVTALNEMISPWTGLCITNTTTHSPLSETRGNFYPRLLHIVATVVNPRVIGRLSLAVGTPGSEKRHRPRLCNEDPPEGGHAGERTGKPPEDGPGTRTVGLGGCL